jgi:hypothetical protein
MGSRLGRRFLQLSGKPYHLGLNADRLVVFDKGSLLLVSVALLLVASDWDVGWWRVHLLCWVLV